MKKIAILGCKRIQDQLCVACAKCLKAFNEREGEFKDYDADTQLVGLTNCGDCPGLVMPKVGLVKGIASGLGNDIETLHIATCVVKAVETADCKIDIQKTAERIKENMGIDVVVGTHYY